MGGTQRRRCRYGRISERMTRKCVRIQRVRAAEENVLTYALTLWEWKGCGW